MEPAATPPADGPPGWPDWIETWVLPFVEEPVLWPVLLAILGHVVVLFALGVLDVVRGTGLGAMGLSLLLTAGAVGWEIRSLHRVGAVSAAMGITWVAAAVLAGVALKTGFL